MMKHDILQFLGKKKLVKETKKVPFCPLGPTLKQDIFGGKFEIPGIFLARNVIKSCKLLQSLKKLVLAQDRKQNKLSISTLMEFDKIAVPSILEKKLQQRRRFSWEKNKYFFTAQGPKS